MLQSSRHLDLRAPEERRFDLRIARRRLGSRTELRWFRLDATCFRQFGVAAVLVAASVMAGACGGPTSTPAPASIAVTLSPSSISFLGTRSAYAFTATQNDYSGLFTVSTPASGQTNACSGIATVTPLTGFGIFTVIPVGAGQCTFTVTGGSGQTATLPVGVTITSVGGS